VNIDYLVPLCAELSLKIYDQGHFIPPGWDLLHSYEDGGTGYRGACYTRNLLTKNAQMIIVHRGTVLNIPNIIGDIEIAMGKIPFQIGSIEPMIMSAIEKLNKIYRVGQPDGDVEMLKYLQVISTGHSMGAILADYFALGSLGSITFEN